VEGFGKVLVEQKGKAKMGARSSPASAKTMEEKKRREKERRREAKKFAPSRLTTTTLPTSPKCTVPTIALRDSDDDGQTTRSHLSQR
jgi:hypothetical protein